MADMLVRLRGLPSLEAAIAACARDKTCVRRALLPERPIVMRWVTTEFASWGAEIDATFSRQPVSCFIAVRGGSVIGVAAYDAIAKGMFGPTGVHPDERGRGVGRALLLSALHALEASGYAYAIIGAVGPAAYYEKTVGASLIAGPAWCDSLLRSG